MRVGNWIADRYLEGYNIEMKEMSQHSGHSKCLYTARKGNKIRKLLVERTWGWHKAEEIK